MTTALICSPNSQHYVSHGYQLLARAVLLRSDSVQSVERSMPIGNVAAYPSLVLVVLTSNNS